MALIMEKKKIKIKIKKKKLILIHQLIQKYQQILQKKMILWNKVYNYLNILKIII